MKITGRYGTSPADRCTGQSSCPDILALDTGDYLIIGTLATVEDITPSDLARHGASIGEDEAPVLVPRAVVHAAVLDIAGRALNGEEQP